VACSVSVTLSGPADIRMRLFGGSEDTAAIADTVEFVTTGSAPNPEQLVFRVYGTAAGTTGAYALTRTLG
jgi:hypothetical protein